MFEPLRFGSTWFLFFLRFVACLLSVLVCLFSLLQTLVEVIFLTDFGRGYFPPTSFSLQTLVEVIFLTDFGRGYFP